MTGTCRHRFGAVALSALSLLGAVGCGRDVAQTAFREGTEADEFSCETPLSAPPAPPS